MYIAAVMLAARPGETEDLATLSTLDEAILLEELKVRYSKDKIYVSNLSMLARAHDSIFFTDLHRRYFGGSKSFQITSNLLTGGKIDVPPTYSAT